MNDMDLMKLVRHLCAVDNFRFQFQLLPDAQHLVVLQNLVEQNRDEHLPYLDVVHRLNLLVVEVGVELHHLLKMDYFPDVVDVERQTQLKMDYFPDVAH